MKPVLKYLFLLFVVSCYPVVLKARDYAAYYRQTMLAEEAVLNEQFDVALRHYQAAFNGYDFKFVRDVFIAAESAAFMRKDSITFTYLKYCMERGLKYDCLMRPVIFHEFSKTKYAKRLQAMEEACLKKYRTSIDTNLNKEFARRYDREQRAKTAGGEAYYKIVDDNLKRIQELLNAGKYPGEQLIGTLNSVLPLRPDIFGSFCSFQSGMAQPTLQHYSYSFDLLGDKLVKAMNEGMLHPQELVCIYVFSASRQCGYPKTKPENIKGLEQGRYANLVFNLPFEKCAKADTATANGNRSKWFIPRTGTIYKAGDILKTYGIATAIGDWAGGER